MRNIILALAAVLLLGSAVQACNYVSRSSVVAVRSNVVVERYAVASVVVPTVAVTTYQASYAYPVYAAPIYAAPIYAPPATDRLERLERSVEKLAASQEQILERLKAPK